MGHTFSDQVLATLKSSLVYRIFGIPVDMLDTLM